MSGSYSYWVSSIDLYQPLNKYNFSSSKLGIYGELVYLLYPIRPLHITWLKRFSVSNNSVYVYMGNYKKKLISKDVSFITSFLSREEKLRLDFLTAVRHSGTVLSLLRL